MNTRDRIIRYAKGAIGCAYDRTPSGGVEGESYNCSYLTFCAYRFAGLEIPTWQGAQNGRGSQSDWVIWEGNWTTDPNDLQKGDLVFFGYYDDDLEYYVTSHVGISLGGTRMIDSVPNGGVQERELYDSFCGGGSPLDFDVEPVIEEVTGKMQGIISIENRNTLVYLNGDEIHDITEPECVEALNKVATAFTGKPLRVVELAENEYALLCQVMNAGQPIHLHDLNTMFPPRG